MANYIKTLIACQPGEVQEAHLQDADQKSQNTSEKGYVPEFTAGDTHHNPLQLLQGEGVEPFLHHAGDADTPPRRLGDLGQDLFGHGFFTDRGRMPGERSITAW